MMGSNHAISGAAAWIAVTGTTGPVLGILPMEPAGVLTGALLCAGAVMIPDADHPQATIAFSVPGGSAIAGVVGAATGGHRKGMHSLLAVIIATLAVYFITTGDVLEQLTIHVEQWPVPLPLATIAIIAACTCFSVKVLKIVSTWPRAWLVGGLLAIATTVLFPDLASWLPLCIGIGYLTHIAGDMLTSGGVPLLWPWMPEQPKIVRGTFLSHIWRPNGAFALPLLGNTGSWREWVFGLALTAYVAWVGGLTAFTIIESVLQFQ